MVESPKSLQSQAEILLHSSSQGGEPLSTLVYTGPSFFKKPLSYSVVILSAVSNEPVYPRNAPFQCFWSIRQLSWPVSQLVCNVLERSSEKADNYKLPCCWIDTMLGLELGLYSLPCHSLDLFRKPEYSLCRSRYSDVHVKPSFSEDRTEPAVTLSPVEDED